MNSSETYWSVDGVSLQTYATNITNLGDSRLAPPPLRGSDVVIPYSPGRMWQPKITDSRTITLAMWVIGADEDGNVPRDVNQRRKFEQNFRALRNLLWTPRRQIEVTKRFYVEGYPQTFTATAKAQFVGGLSPSMTGDARAVFTVDLFLADPYFYGEEIGIELSDNVPNVEIEVLGDDRTYNIELDFYGPLDSPRVTSGIKDKVTVAYNYDISDIESATLKVKKFSSKEFLAGDWIDKNLEEGLEKVTTGYNFYKVPDKDFSRNENGTYNPPYNFKAYPLGSHLYPVDSVFYQTSGFVDYQGDPFWFYLDPGQAFVKLTKAGGAGSVVLRYKPAWL